MHTATSAREIGSVSQLIDRFGGASEFARIIGKNPSTASEMKRRGSIPINYWQTIIETAPDRGIEGLTTDRLVALHLATREAAE